MAATREASARRARPRRRKQATGHLRGNGRAVARALGGTLAEIRDRADEGIDRAEAGVQEVERTFRNYIRRRPVRTLLIGASVVALAGIGVAVGARWLRKT